jgi:hypothetical protein
MKNMIKTILKKQIEFRDELNKYFAPKIQNLLKFDETGFGLKSEEKEKATIYVTDLDKDGQYFTVHFDIILDGFVVDCDSFTKTKRQWESRNT